MHSNRILLIGLILLAQGGWVFGQVVSGKTDVDLNDGPYLFHRADGSVEARWIAKGKSESKSFPAGSPVRLPQFRDLLGESLTIAKHEIADGEWPMPEKVIAISDVEGEYDRLRRFLKASGIMGAKGRWAFGKGHVVCVGDFVDRGEKVTETLWLLHRLDREALAAGGRLHFVIGNHEAMVMAGDVRYTAAKYQKSAAMLGLSIPALLGPDTELGRWLRSKNALVRLGEFVFVHAGVSPWVAKKKVDYRSLNDRIRSSLGKRPKAIKSVEVATLAWGRQGPLWYRGYFDGHAAGFGPQPDLRELDRILACLSGKSIVVGHTKVRRVQEIAPKRRVIAIDTTWVSDRKVAGLLMTKKEISILDIEGKKSPLKPEDS